MPAPTLTSSGMPPRLPHFPPPPRHYLPQLFCVFPIASSCPPHLLLPCYPIMHCAAYTCCIYSLPCQEEEDGWMEEECYELLPNMPAPLPQPWPFPIAPCVCVLFPPRSYLPHMPACLPACFPFHCPLCLLIPHPYLVQCDGEEFIYYVVWWTWAPHLPQTFTFVLVMSPSYLPPPPAHVVLLPPAPFPRRRGRRLPHHHMPHPSWTPPVPHARTLDTPYLTQLAPQCLLYLPHYRRQCIARRYSSIHNFCLHTCRLPMNLPSCMPLCDSFCQFPV